MHLNGVVGDSGDDALSLHNDSVVDIEQTLLKGGCRLLDVEPVDIGEESPVGINLHGEDDVVGIRTRILDKGVFECYLDVVFC